MRAHHCELDPVVLPEGHRFPMGKYAMLSRRLVAEGLVAEEDLRPAPHATRAELLHAHDAAWVDAFCAGAIDREAERRVGFPWSPELVRRCLASVGGTLASARAALEGGVAGALAGGTHHAHAGFGAGFCAFNDLAVTARVLLAEERVRRVLVLDLDVHQGDGTAAICAGDERVFTCSLHGARNFPARKQASDLDVPLADGIGDAAYLAALEGALATAWDRARPDLVLYQAGVDPLAEDKLGRLALTHSGLAERDARVFARARAAGVPVAFVLGGGYAVPIERSVEAHVGTWRAATGRGVLGGAH